MKKNRVSQAEMDDLNNAQAFKRTNHCRNRATLKYFTKVCGLFNRLFSKTVFICMYGMHLKLIGMRKWKFQVQWKYFWFHFIEMCMVYIILRNTVQRSNLRTKLSSLFTTKSGSLFTTELGSLFATKLGSLFGIYSIKTELMKLVNIWLAHSLRVE